MDRRVLLLILDGWGIAPANRGNAISQAKTPNFDMLWSKYPHTTLNASGEAVGLPEGQIGNSEVGHLNIGAGRLVWQDLPRITESVKDGSFYNNQTLLEAFLYAREKNKKVHFLGLTSPGGVHSHQDHLYALLEMAKENKVHDVYIHAFTDGRDVPPKSAYIYLDQLENRIKQIGIGKIATVTGRYYAMDRDNRWERTAQAYNALVLGQGEVFQTAKEAIEKSYKRGIYDEFVRPSIISKEGLIKDGDVVVFFNLRSDRPRQLTHALVSKIKEMKRENKVKDLYFVTLTQYEKNLPVKVAFPPEEIKNCLGEVLADHDIKQFRLAETEKYAHVTFFFNGGREESFRLEERDLVPSPKVATYDLKPEMSAPQVCRDLMGKLGRYGFIAVNFANPDMVGHTGKIEETVKAVEVVDACLGGAVLAAQSLNYDVIIIADHGNAEKMINFDGSPCTAHTTNKVPFILVSEDKHTIKNSERASLSNVAPTILKLLKIEKPSEMKSSSLI